MKNFICRLFVVANVILFLLFLGECNVIAEAESYIDQSAQPVIVLEKTIARSMTNLDQQYRIEIYQNLNVVFIGIANTKILGQSRGVISKNQYSALLAGFIDVQFSSLDPVYRSDLINHSYAKEGEGGYQLHFRFREVNRSVQIRTDVPLGTPPGVRLLIDYIKRITEARQWACPFNAKPAIGGEMVAVCEFGE
jgi:hypothetical protein